MENWTDVKKQFAINSSEVEFVEICWNETTIHIDMEIMKWRKVHLELIWASEISIIAFYIP